MSAYQSESLVVDRDQKTVVVIDVEVTSGNIGTDYMPWYY